MFLIHNFDSFEHNFQKLQFLFKRFEKLQVLFFEILYKKIDFLKSTFLWELRRQYFRKFEFEHASLQKV